jgi:hypothetical protein
MLKSKPWPAPDKHIMLVLKSKAWHAPDKSAGLALLAHVPKPRLKHGTLYCYLDCVGSFGPPSYVPFRPDVPWRAHKFFRSGYTSW